MIHQGDCLKYLKKMEDKSVDLILQDPPYFTTACDWEWDIMTKIDEFWAEWKRVIKDNGAIVMTASQPFTSKLVMSNLKMFKYEWVWDKVVKRGHLVSKIRPLQRTESIIVFGKGRLKYNPQEIERDKPVAMKEGSRTEIMGKKQKSNYRTIRTTFLPSNLIIFSNGGDKNKLHPTQKPVALMEYLIKTYTSENDVVLDGFAGSFTTAVACDNLKRQWICCELDEKYCDIGKKRINENRARLNSDLLG